MASVTIPGGEGPITITTGAVATTLASGVSSGAASLPVASGSGLAAGHLLLVNSGSLAEIVKVGSVSGNTVNLTDGGTKNAHGSSVGVTRLQVTGLGQYPLSPYLSGT